MPFPISKTTLGIIIAILAALAYGVAPSTTRFAYSDGANAAFMIFIIAVSRALIFTFFCIVSKRALFVDRAHTKIAITNGFFQALSMITLAIAMVYLPGPVAITILFTFPLMLYALLVFKGEEQLNIITIISIITTILGVTLVIDLYSESQSIHLWGVCLAFIGALATTSRIYVLGNILQNRDAPTIGAEAYLFALIFSGLFLFYDVPIAPVSFDGWVSALISGIASTLGGFALFYSIQLIGAFRFSFISKLEPVFAAIFAAVLINEILSVEQYMGIAIVIVSLIFYQSQQAHKQKG